MARLLKNLTITVLFTSLLIIMIMVFKKTMERKKTSEEIKQNAINDIDLTLKTLKESIGTKSAGQLDKIMDTAIENAKNDLDKLSEQIKKRMIKSS